MVFFKQLAFTITLLPLLITALPTKATKATTKLPTHIKAKAVLTAASISRILPRETCVDTCGSTCYYQSDVDTALKKGYSLYQSGDTLGSDDYPHQYKDLEGFSFPDDGPWYEFPILNDYEVYSGVSPGADRVVFDGEGEFQALITHTGASGNGFLECTAN